MVGIARCWPPAATHHDSHAFRRLRGSQHATVSVYDRRRRRLGTIYVGQMPEAKQATLSGTLTQLLRATLEDWHGPLPRLAYITDKGSACDEYYHDVLEEDEAST